METLGQTNYTHYDSSCNLHFAKTVLLGHHSQPTHPSPHVYTWVAFKLHCRLPCLQCVTGSRQSDCPVYSGRQAQGSQVCNARLTGGRHSSVKLTDEQLIRADTNEIVDDCELCAGCCCCQGYRNLCYTYPASPKTSPGPRYFLHLVTFHVHASKVRGHEWSVRSTYLRTWLLAITLVCRLTFTSIR